MSYQLFSKKRQQRKNLGLKIFGVIFFIASCIFVFSLFGGTFTKASSGVVNATEGLGSLFGAVIGDKEALIIKNEQLQNELDKQTVDRQVQIALIERNNQLLAELGRGEPVQKVLAGVITKPPFSPYDVYTTDAGTENGIEVGDLAMYSDYVALGQVNRTTTTGSKIILYSAPGKETQMVLNKSVFVATGQGGGTIRIDAPRDFQVEVGATVTLPGYNLYVTGLVQAVEFRPQDSFKKVMIKVPVNIEQVNLVSIIPYSKEIPDEITEIPTTQ